MNLDQQRRYARQIMLPEIGAAGQSALLSTRVLVIGAGGLGSALVTYLAAAGIGHLGIIDDDRVELSNLARQILHETGDIGRLKTDSAADRVSELNPDVRVTPYPFAITAENAQGLITQYDIVADGCDNFASRFAVNAACVAAGIPLVSAAIAGWQGQLTTFAPARVPGSGCYHCLVHPDAPEANTCRESGIVGPLAGIVGSMQALEVIRLALGRPALIGTLARIHGLSHAQPLTQLTRDPTCIICK